MTDIERFDSLPYRIEAVRDSKEGGYVAYYPELKGCITCGETLIEAVKNAEDAKRAWLEAAIEDGIDIPLPDELKDYSGQFKLRMPKSLHSAIAKNAKIEGVSMNQYCVYLLSKEVGLLQLSDESKL